MNLQYSFFLPAFHVTCLFGKKKLLGGRKQSGVITYFFYWYYLYTWLIDIRWENQLNVVVVVVSHSVVSDSLGPHGL